MLCCSAACCVLMWRRAHVAIHNGFPYIYIYIIYILRSIHICRRYWRRGQGEKTTRNKNNFFVLFLFGNRKTDFKKTLFGRENRKIKRPTITIFGFRFTTLSIAVYVQIYSQHVSVSSYILVLLQLAT